MRCRFLLAAALLSLITPVLASPAAASPWDDAVTFGKAVQAHGITITVDHACEAGTAAYYSSSRRTIALCNAVFSRGDHYLLEALTHETVHAVQHCVGSVFGTRRITPIATLLAIAPNRPSGIRGSQLAREDNPARAARFNSWVQQSSSSRNRGVAYSMLSGFTRNSAAVHEQLEREAYALERNPQLVLELMETICS